GRAVHRRLPRHRRGDLDLLGDQVPGRHGPDADLHVPVEHDRRDLAAAGSGTLPDQYGEAAHQGLMAAQGEERGPRAAFFALWLLIGDRCCAVAPMQRAAAVSEVVLSSTYCRWRTSSKIIAGALFGWPVVVK